MDFCPTKTNFGDHLVHLLYYQNHPRGPCGGSDSVLGVAFHIPTIWPMFKQYIALHRLHSIDCIDWYRLQCSSNMYVYMGIERLLVSSRVSPLMHEKWGLKKKWKMLKKGRRKSFFDFDYTNRRRLVLRFSWSFPYFAKPLISMRCERSNKIKKSHVFNISMTPSPYPPCIYIYIYVY